MLLTYVSLSEQRSQFRRQGKARIMNNVVPINIESISVSTGHNYWKNKMGTPGVHPTKQLVTVRAVADCGLEGDRFFRTDKVSKGQITFFSIETYEEMKKQLNIANVPVELCRRNIIVRGIDVMSLIGKKFNIGDVEFEGTMHCTPCEWMDNAFGKGALAFLNEVGGGLRAKILKSGNINIGQTNLKVL